MQIVFEEHSQIVHPVAQHCQPFNPEAKGKTPELFAIDTIKGMHFGNPEMQDFSKVRPLLEEKKICMLWDEALAPEFRDQVKTGIVVKEVCQSLDEAKATLESYQKDW